MPEMDPQDPPEVGSDPGGIADKQHQDSSSWCPGDLAWGNQEQGEFFFQVGTSEDHERHE
jgi:hypothetical protein